MSEANEYLVRVLRSGDRALAAYASGDLLERAPSAGEAFGPDPFAAWQAWLAVRVEELAAALAVDQPRLFTAQVRWAKAVFAARGLAADHLRVGLECLRDVFRRELPDDVRGRAAKYVDEALAGFDEESGEPPPRLRPDEPGGRLASEYLLAALEGERRRAREVVLRAVGDGLDVRDAYLNVLVPAQRELGRMWLVGEINVAEEHFASTTTRMVMSQLLALAPLPPPNGKTMLAAAVSGNDHDIGLQAVGDFFEMDGWRTIHLGANVPIGDLVQAVDFFRSDLLGLSATQTTHLAGVRDAIRAVRDRPRGEQVKVLVGGPAFSTAEDLAETFGADAHAAGPREAVAIGNRLVGLSTP
jgi:methanogenic corrinoid protein MtbC1